MFSQGVIAYLLPLKVQSLGYDSRLSGTLMSTFGIIAVLVFLYQRTAFLIRLIL